MPPPQSPKLTLTPEELERVAQARARNEGTKVDTNWLFIAEFGYYFGWDGVMAILRNEISLEVANVLLQGAIKVWYGKLVQQSQGNYIATRAANSKNGKQVLDKGLKTFTKNMKADE